MHCVLRLQKVRLEYSRYFDRLDIATSCLFRKKMFRIIIIYQLIDKILIGLDSAKVLYITMCFQVSENWLKGCAARHFSWCAQRRSTVIPFWFGKNNKINHFLNLFFSNVGYRCRRSDTVATDLQGEPRYDNVHLLEFLIHILCHAMYKM